MKKHLEKNIKETQQFLEDKVFRIYKKTNSYVVIVKYIFYLNYTVFQIKIS